MGGTPGNPRAVPRRGARHPGRTPTPPPIRAPGSAARTVRSGATTGTRGSERCPSSPRPTCQPGRDDPACGRDARGPDHTGSPGTTGGRSPRGNLTGIVSGDVSAHARRGEAPPSHRPGPLRARTQAQLPAEASGEGFFSRTARRTPRLGPSPGQGRARGEDLPLPRGGERLQAEVEPVRHRSDDRGARRRHSPSG